MPDPTPQADDAPPHAPEDPLARAIFDWLEPGRLGREPAGVADLTSTDRERLRRLQSESAAGARVRRPAPALPFERIGRFRLVRPLGAGGIGRVFLAEDDRGARVALKVLREERAGDARDRERFLREGKAAAAVDHPGCVRVIECGEERDVLFVAMEYVDGEGLDERLRRLSAGGLRMPLPRALSIGIELCGALEALHSSGLVHRDVKPANVRLARDGRVVLVDFGLVASRSFATLTRTGEFAGSLPYAAPEQIERGASAVDGRADVYSLGALLYECLTGCPPHAGASTEQIVLAVVHDDPVAPASLNPALGRDAQNVLMKALEKDPGRRYASAAELRDDLAALLGDRPVRARSRDAQRRLASLLRRRPALVLVSALAFFAAVVLPSVLLVQQLRHNRALRAQNDFAHAQRLAAQSRLAFAEDPALALLLARASLERAPTLEGRNALVLALHELKEEKTFTGPFAGPLHLVPARVGALLVAGDGALFAVASAIAPCGSVAQQTRVAAAGGGRFVLLRATHDGCAGAVLSADGAAPIATFDLPGRAPVSAAISADGAALAVGCMDGSVALLDVATGAERWTRSVHSGPVQSVAFDRDGANLLSLGDGELLRTALAPPDGEASEHEVVRSDPDGGEMRFALAPDGRTIALAGAAGVRLLDAATGAVQRDLGALDARHAVLAFSGDGGRLLVATRSGLCRVFALESDDPPVDLAGHRGPIASAFFLDDAGDRAITCGEDPDLSVRVWRTRRLAAEFERARIDPGVQQALRLGASDALACRIEQEGPRFAVIVDAKTGAELWRLPPTGLDLGMQADVLNGSSVFLTTAGLCEVHGARKGELLRPIDTLQDAPRAASLSADGERLAFLDRGGRLLVCTPGGEDEPRPCTIATPDARLVADAGAAIVVAGRQPKLEIVDPVRGASRCTIDLPAMPTGLVAAPRGDRVAALLTRPPRTTLYALVDVAAARLESVFEAPDHMTQSFGFSPDGRELLLCSGPHLLVLDPGGSARELRNDGVTTVAARHSPDGARIAAVDARGRLQVYDARSGERWVEFSAGERCMAVEWSADSREAITIDAAGSLKRWPLDDCERLASERSPRSFSPAEMQRYLLSVVETS